MTTILGSVAINQITDTTDTTKALAVNFAGSATGTTSTLVLPNAGQTFTMPNASMTIVGENNAQTLTNKTINASLNSISNISNANIDPAAAIDGSKISGDISGNAGNVTGMVLVANGGTGATSAASARTNLSAAQSGTNADITSLTQTTVVALKGGSNAVSMQADPATTVWTMQLPAGAGSSGQFLRTNGAGVLAWAAAVGGGSFPAMGNVAIVDAVNGDNGTASVGGLPFLTITAALAAVSAGQLVYILPGTYVETITIPTDVSVRGMSLGEVIIQQTGVTSNTTMVTMGINSHFADVTLNLTSATAGLTLKGIEFPGTSADASKVRNCTIQITNTSTSTGTIYGIHASGTGGTSPGTIRTCLLQITSAVTTKVVGIYSDNASTLQIRDTIISVQRTSGAGLYYGLETSNASAVLICWHSTISGTSADITQTSGSIQLSNTTLQTNTANSLGFTSLDAGKFMVFSAVGASGSWTGTNGRFLRFGTASLNATNVGYVIPVKCILKAIYVQRGSPSGDMTFIVRINSVNTALSITLVGTATTGNLTNVSVPIAAGALLAVGLGQTVNNSGTDPRITIETY